MLNRLINNPVFAGTVVALLVGGLLSIFLAVKIVGEIISWEGNDTYPTNTITVNGEGEVLAVPDIATFSFTVSQNEDSVENAQDGATEIINKAVDFLKDNGVEEKDIKTTSYNVYPQYSSNRPCTTFECPPYNPEIIGYEVRQTTQVKVRQAEESGRFLTELGRLGVSNVSGLSFITDDEEIYKEQAKEKAIKDAKEKAKKLAKELDVDLEDIVSFGEDQPYVYANTRAESLDSVMTLEAKVTPTISQGENSYTAKVWITYEID